jgi:hypothetical protein
VDEACDGGCTMAMNPPAAMCSVVTECEAFIATLFHCKCKSYAVFVFSVCVPACA